MAVCEYSWAASNIALVLAWVHPGKPTGKVALSKKTVPGLVPIAFFNNPQEHGFSLGCMLTRRKIKGPDKTSWFAFQRYYCLARSSHTPLASLHVIKHNVTFARQVCKNETHFLRKRSEFN